LVKPEINSEDSVVPPGLHHVLCFSQRYRAGLSLAAPSGLILAEVGGGFPGLANAARPGAPGRMINHKQRSTALSEEVKGSFDFVRRSLRERLTALRMTRVFIFEAGPTI
jgi:hypothetical protein